MAGYIEKLQIELGLTRGRESALTESLRLANERNGKLVEAFEIYAGLSWDNGHLHYCAAIKGPRDESWIEAGACDCELKQLKAALTAMKENHAQNDR